MQWERSVPRLFAVPESSLGFPSYPLLSMWPCSFQTVPPSLALWLQRPLLLPDHRHPGVSAGLPVLTDPSHRHARVHPSLGRGQQRTQGPRFLCGHRPTAQPDQRLQPWTRTHRQSLPVSLPVLCCVWVLGYDPLLKDKGWRRVEWKWRMVW